MTGLEGGLLLEIKNFKEGYIPAVVSSITQALVEAEEWKNTYFPLSKGYVRKGRRIKSYRRKGKRVKGYIRKFKSPITIPPGTLRRTSVIIPQFQKPLRVSFLGGAPYTSHVQRFKTAKTKWNNPLTKEQFFTKWMEFYFKTMSQIYIREVKKITKAKTRVVVKEEFVKELGG
jgi:hypothetical protein